VQVLNSIWSLLLVPDMDDPAYFPGGLPVNVRNMIITQQFYSEEAALEVAIKEHVAKHAMKTRAEWARELGADI
jgi:hypothetical protein